MSPHDADVWHWPPDERERPLRSAAEVREWLSAHGEQASVVDCFSFSPQVCLSDFPAPDGGPASVGELPASTTSTHQHPEKFRVRDYWVEMCRGYVIRRYFDFTDASSFRFDYAVYLRQFSHLVVEDLVRQLEKMRDERDEADALRSERVDELKELYSPMDGSVRSLRESSMSLECLNLLTQAQSCTSAGELTESPHLMPLTAPNEGGSPVYTFPLFTPAYAESLAEGTKGYPTTPPSHHPTTPPPHHPTTTRP